ncbi:MAG TPA: AMP-binding protein [Steroidobacter sp.]|uniref:AMP-binding protein n=1 Tax=Steroidobacter sp. TaxID=1978227 RepID=UPI002EDB289D
MNKPWLKHYPPGTPAEIELDPNATLIDMFLASCVRYATRPAFHNWGTTLTCSELEQRSRAFAAWLRAHGFHKGDRIALMLPNVLQYPVAMFGALRAGLVVVNTNPLYTPRELEHQLRDSGAACIVVLANFAHVVERVLPNTNVRTVVTTELGDLLRFPKGTALSWAARHLKRLVPEYHIPQAISFRQALETGARLTFTPPSIAADDLAFLQYTGGTTGVAKGAMLSHRNLMANLEQVSTLWRSYIHDGAEIVITPLPLYHVFCLTCNCLTFFKHGGLNVLITNPRDIPSFVAELARWRFTMITGVNTLYNALLAHPRLAHVNFSKLRMSVAGGMALHPDVAERWRKLTGNTLIEGYGLTEASPVVACNLPEASRLGSVGVPLPSTEISIRDEGREVDPGQPGELHVRGPQVMRGYWNMPEETAQCLDKDGWLRTGDVATLDEDGFVHIVDRKKDMIIVSGFKVFPNEIEAVLTMHEAIVEAGCIGVPDDRSGQAVKAFVVTESTLSTEQIIEFCRERLTPYKVPKYVEFRATLPKTNIGKILRRALVEEASKESHGATGTADH